MGVPVSIRRYTSCSPPYPRGYFLCPSGWRKDKTHLQNSYNFGVGGLLSQIFKTAVFISPEGQYQTS